ncbi:hypothetical protein FOS14_03305 [Skermania sp. ID1734]|uniref:hypothetical protein n=1 Tax=Skermania sp. ID1734 TaxID=2597516 RepID=UPI00117F3AA3|nr:hypothetical protein [Skermania sp. ID1734]TSE01577.1 hypothetical protein FOS14_03305 [Skermania sp. ID1734]
MRTNGDYTWYVAYASNMSIARFACYLEGGCPPGATLTYVGARDASPPRASLPITLPGSLFFAGESRAWGGGRAFYDPEIPGPTPARAYLITNEQFADLRAQEPPVYDRLLEIGMHQGFPMLTFTGQHGRKSVAWRRPSQPYLHTIAAGLAETHGWTATAISNYFERLGVNPVKQR